MICGLKMFTPANREYVASPLSLNRYVVVWSLKDWLDPNYGEGQEIILERAEMGHGYR